MLIVIPGEKYLAEGPDVLDTTKTVRKLGAVFHRAELAFRIRIVVGGVGPAMGLGHAQVGQQQGHRLGPHGRSAVGMQAELTGLDILLFACFFDQLASQFGALARRHHPADNVTAEDIEDDVEIKIVPLGGAAQLGNIPTPELIGGGRQQLRFRYCG